MPTTEPLDQGDDAEGQLKPIAIFAQPAAPQQAPQPTATPQPQPKMPRPVAPQPPPAQRPVQPAAPQAAPAGTRKYAGINAPSLRMTPVHHANHESAATHAPVQARNNPFTDDDLNRAWDTFIEQNPTEHILVNTMRASHPQKIDGGYRVTVENDTQVMILHENMPRLKQYLGDALSNDNINFEIASNVGESSPLTWNDRQVLKHIADTNPGFKDFYISMALKL